jgi:hypothetical protein
MPHRSNAEWSVVFIFDLWRRSQDQAIETDFRFRLWMWFSKRLETMSLTKWAKSGKSLEATSINSKAPADSLYLF